MARPPATIHLPAPAGKTACLDIAIWALAAQADRPRGQRCAARRIWFVVDRRIQVGRGTNCKVNFTPAQSL